MSQPLHILYVVAYPYRMAGANRGLLDLIVNLPSGVRATVAMTAEGAAAEAYREAGLDVVVVPATGGLGEYGKAFLRKSMLQKVAVGLRDGIPFWVRLGRLIRRIRPHIVHVNDPRAALVAGPPARLAGLPVVTNVKGELAGTGGVWRIAEALSNRFIVISKGALRTLGPSAQERSHIVYDGAELSVEGEGTIPWLETMRDGGVRVAAMFASVVPFKGHHHLLDAVAVLNRRGWAERAAFVCIGDFPEGYERYHDWLLDSRERLGITNLTFAGWQTDPFPFYNSVDFTVLPSVSAERLDVGGEVLEVRGDEGFPRTHVEAMCRRLPIVGTAISGVPEQIVDGETGLLVPPHQTDALADAIERLLADPTLAIRMGEAAKERAYDKFSMGAYIDGVMSVYKELLDLPAPAR